jgi:hypothetical protein
MEIDMIWRSLKVVNLVVQNCAASRNDAASERWISSLSVPILFTSRFVSLILAEPS